MTPVKCGHCALLSTETPCPRCGWTTRPDGEVVPPTAEDLCPNAEPCHGCRAAAAATARRKALTDATLEASRAADILAAALGYRDAAGAGDHTVVTLAEAAAERLVAGAGPRDVEQDGPS